MSEQERIQFGEITLERQEDGWVASGIIREHGKTAMDTLYKLGYMYPCFTCT